MSKRRFLVDFNERIETNLILLSKTDEKIDSSGAKVTLAEGLPVEIYQEDTDLTGKPDNLIARGVVERNLSALSWAKAAKWCCRVDAHGIRWESDEHDCA